MLTNSLVHLAVIPISVLVVYVCVRLWLLTKWHYWKTRGVPYLSPVYPVFGNMQDFLWMKTLPDVCERIYQKTKGIPYVGIYAFHTPVLFVRDLDIAAKIMTTDFIHFEERGFVLNERDPLCKNLIHQNGHEWRVFRSKISASLSNKRVKDMFPIMKAKSKFLLRYIEEKQFFNGVVEVYDACVRFAIDVLANITLGLEAQTLQNENSSFNYIIKNLFRLNLIVHILMGCFLPNIHKMLGITAANRKVTMFFDSVVKQVLIEKRKYGLCERNDVVQKLLKLKEDCSFPGPNNALPVNHDSIVGQISGLFLAGFESTGNILACILYELAKSQEIQDILHFEITSVLDSCDNELTTEALNQMKYLHQVLQETLRMYAPLAIIFRRCTKDYTIPGTSSVVTKGTLVIFPLRSVLLDSNYYPNPTKFDPTRFTEDNCKDRASSPTMFIPFGTGPRNCPAMQYSYIQIKVALVEILCELEVHTCGQTPQYYQPDPLKFLLAPKNGLPVIFRKRQTSN